MIRSISSDPFRAPCAMSRSGGAKFAFSKPFPFKMLAHARSLISYRNEDAPNYDFHFFSPPELSLPGVQTRGCRRESSFFFLKVFFGRVPLWAPSPFGFLTIQHRRISIRFPELKTFPPLPSTIQQNGCTWVIPLYFSSLSTPIPASMEIS